MSSESFSMLLGAHRTEEKLGLKRQSGTGNLYPSMTAPKELLEKGDLGPHGGLG